MPEGDVLWRTAQQLHAALAGRELVGVDLRWPGVAGAGLRGRRTVEVVPRGKHLLHRIEGDVTIHSHLRMDGSWRLAPLTRVTPRYARHPLIRAILAAGDRAAIGWDLGMLDVLPTAQEHQVVGHLGPDILGADWDEASALRNLAAHPDQPIGAALLDQRNLAGIGTIYASESLFACRAHPWRTVGETEPATQQDVIRTARSLMTEAIRSRTGLIRRRVHGRSGQPCPRCGMTLRIALIGNAPDERALPYCRTCQGGLAPTDDGRPMSPLGHRGS